MDIPYHYLRFFLEDEAQLEEVRYLNGLINFFRVKYGKGEMMTSVVKKLTVDVISKLLTEH